MKSSGSCGRGFDRFKIFFTFRVAGAGGSRTSCLLAEAGSVGIERPDGPLGLCERCGSVGIGREEEGPRGRSRTCGDIALSFWDISGFGGIGVVLLEALKAKLNFDEFCWACGPIGGGLLGGGIFSSSFFLVSSLSSTWRSLDGLKRSSSTSSSAGSDVPSRDVGYGGYCC